MLIALFFKIGAVVIGVVIRLHHRIIDLRIGNGDPPGDIRVLFIERGKFFEIILGVTVRDIDGVHIHIAAGDLLPHALQHRILLPVAVGLPIITADVYHRPNQNNDRYNQYDLTDEVGLAVIFIGDKILDKSLHQIPLFLAGATLRQISSVRLCGMLLHSHVCLPPDLIIEPILVVCITIVRQSAKFVALICLLAKSSHRLGRCQTEQRN